MSASRKLSPHAPQPDEPRPVTSARVVVASDATECREHVDAWNELAANALDDNVYLTPQFLIPALTHLEPRLRVAMVYATVQGSERMIGCAAFGSFRTLGKLPFAGLSSGLVPHGYVGLPLIDRRFVTPAIAALQDWLDAGAATTPLTVWSRIPRRSATWAALRRELDQRGRSLWVRSEFQRPALTQGLSFDERIAGLSKSRRKSYRRNWRRLAAMGDVRVNVHRDLSEAPDIAARFMDLEGSGWKGEGGTALACSSASQAFFREATASLAQERRILFVELQVDNRPVAITANFVHGQTMFAFKVAVDDVLAKASPGILAEIETLRAFQHATDLRIGESGTGPDSYLASYWRETTPLAEAVTAPPGSLAARALQIMPLMGSIRRSAAEILSA